MDGISHNTASCQQIKSSSYSLLILLSWNAFQTFPQIFYHVLLQKTSAKLKMAVVMDMRMLPTELWQKYSNSIHVWWEIAKKSLYQRFSNCGQWVETGSSNILLWLKIQRALVFGPLGQVKKEKKKKRKTCFMGGQTCQ